MKDWSIDYQNEHEHIQLHDSNIEAFVRTILQSLQQENIPDSVQNISISFTDDDNIAALNSQYRDKDRPTDVLSFSLLEGEDEGPLFSLGDVIISLDTCLRQATDYDTTADQECARLLIHGILHLFGYDHENVPEEEVLRMQAKEDLLMTVFENDPYTFFTEE